MSLRIKLNPGVTTDMFIKHVHKETTKVSREHYRTRRPMSVKAVIHMVAEIHITLPLVTAGIL